MAQFRNGRPWHPDEILINDGGLETDLIFHRGHV